MTDICHFSEIISVVLDLSTLLFSAWCRVSVVVSINLYFHFDSSHTSLSYTVIHCMLNI